MDEQRKNPIVSPITIENDVLYYVFDHSKGSPPTTVSHGCELHYDYTEVEDARIALHDIMANTLDMAEDVTAIALRKGRRKGDHRT